ncbi:hypothetical protein MRB53_041629 [Persea americana]|nr:hypothetical protein MRB53_041629 [Persea americana]
MRYGYYKTRLGNESSAEKMLTLSATRRQCDMRAASRTFIRVTYDNECLSPLMQSCALLEVISKQERCADRRPCQAVALPHSEKAVQCWKCGAPCCNSGSSKNCGASSNLQRVCKRRALLLGLLAMLFSDGFILPRRSHAAAERVSRRSYVTLCRHTGHLSIDEARRPSSKQCLLEFRLTAKKVKALPYGVPRLFGHISLPSRTPCASRLEHSWAGTWHCCHRHWRSPLSYNVGRGHVGAACAAAAADAGTDKAGTADSSGASSKARVASLSPSDKHDYKCCALKSDAGTSQLQTTCHARKVSIIEPVHRVSNRFHQVRCDAASLGVPCTNCVAFSIECKIPTPRRKKVQSAKVKDTDSDHGEAVQDQQSTPRTTNGGSPNIPEQGGEPPDFNEDHEVYGVMEGDDFMSVKTAAQQNAHAGTHAQVVKPKFVRAPIREAGRVAYLGESSNLSLLVHDKQGNSEVVHYPLPENIRGARARLDELDSVEIDILHQRGAFLLPPRGLCDELVEAFFNWVWPVVPVINRASFMKRYRDSKNPPSLLLLQAVLLAGSRVCKNPQLMDATGSTTPAAMTFYKRAKALFDANYEDDRVTIVQALLLMGWYWEGPEGQPPCRRFETFAEAARCHKECLLLESCGHCGRARIWHAPKLDKRLWKRIWWCLFTRDRSVAVALGRPCCINMEDSDVEMVSEDDFIDDDEKNEFPADPVHVHFFLNYVKLCEIMGLVLSQQYSVASKIRKHNALDLTASDMALADWLQNCPKEVYWERPRHHFWAAAHMPPAGSSANSQNTYGVEQAYPSRNIAYQAAGMITSIIESLQSHDQLRFTPAFM